MKKTRSQRRHHHLEVALAIARVHAKPRPHREIQIKNFPKRLCPSLPAVFNDLFASVVTCVPHWVSFRSAGWLSCLRARGARWSGRPPSAWRLQVRNPLCGAQGIPPRLHLQQQPAQGPHQLFQCLYAKLLLLYRNSLPNPPKRFRPPLSSNVNSLPWEKLATSQTLSYATPVSQNWTCPRPRHYARSSNFWLLFSSRI